MSPSRHHNYHVMFAAIARGLDTACVCDVHGRDRISTTGMRPPCGPPVVCLNRTWTVQLVYRPVFMLSDGGEERSSRLPLDGQEPLVDSRSSPESCYLSTGLAYNFRTTSVRSKTQNVPIVSARHAPVRQRRVRSGGAVGLRPSANRNMGASDRESCSSFAEKELAGSTVSTARVKKTEYFQRNGVATFAIATQVLNRQDWTPDVLADRQKTSIWPYLAEELRR